MTHLKDKPALRRIALLLFLTTSLVAGPGCGSSKQEIFYPDFPKASPNDVKLAKNQAAKGSAAAQQAAARRARHGR